MLHFLPTIRVRTTAVRSKRHPLKQAKSALPSPLQSSVMHPVTDNCWTSDAPVRRGSGKLVISHLFASTEGKVDEERQIRLGRLLRVSRYSGLPVVFPGLERHMEIEYLQEQFSGPGFYYLDFGGR
jgi:hypothetical protein